MNGTTATVRMKNRADGCLKMMMKKIIERLKKLSIGNAALKK
jgi:hypothetical protein